MRTIEWDDERDCVAMVDQTKLPAKYTTYHAETVDELVESIEILRVRGAPALGAAGAFGVALAARTNDADGFDAFAAAVREDAERSADEVEIEQRDGGELREIYGTQNAPEDVNVYNPAFDATPMELVDYLVTEDGMFEPPVGAEELGEEEKQIAR